ncbi:MAG: chemotaxis protein CheC, partial [Oscillospiraceae bacterium]
ENIMVGILTKFNGEIEGIMMYLLEKKFATDIIRQLLGVDVNLDEKLQEIELSVISEIGNILSASYINAIASLTGLNINISVPAVAIDMVGALLCVPAMEMSVVSDEIIFVEGVLIDSNKEVTSNILLVPSMESLNIMMNRLGIDL